MRVSSIITWINTTPEPLTPTIAGNCARIAEVQAPFPTQGNPIMLDTVPSLVLQDEGETGVALAIAWSPDGAVFAVARPQVVSLYDPVTFTRLHTLPHVGVTSLAFTPDGTTLATQDQDNVVQTWNVATGDLLFSKKINGHIRQDIADSMGEIVYALNYGDAAHSLRRLRDDSIVQTYTLPFAITPDTLYADTLGIMVHANEGEVQFWNTDNSQLERSIPRPFGEWNHILEGGWHEGVTGLALTSDETVVAVARRNQTIEVWDIAKKTVRHQFEWATDSPFHYPTHVAFSENGAWLAASGKDDATVAVWNVETHTEKLSVEGNPSDLVAFSPDNGYIAIVNRAETVTVYDLATGEIVGRLEGSARITAFALHPQTPVYASATHEQVDFIQQSTGETLCTLYMGRAVDKIAFSLDGQHAVIEPDYGPLFIVDLPHNHIVGEIPDSDFGAWAIHPTDGTLVVSDSSDEQLVKWSLETGELVSSLTTPTNVVAFSYRPQSDQIAFTNFGSITVTTEANMVSEPIATIPPVGRLFNLVWSPDGQSVVTIEESGFTVHNLVDNKVRWNVKKGAYRDTYYSPNGEWIVTVTSSDPSEFADIFDRIKIWDADTGKLLRQWTTGPRSVTDVAISPNGSAIYTASEDGRVQVWSVEE